MLRGVPAIIPPELLKILAEMGHGDEITIGDANFPGHSHAKVVVRMDGHGVPEVLMQVAPGDNVETPIWETYKEILAKHEARGAACLEEVERQAFYDRVKEKSCAVIMTGEKALYANVILKKGVL